MASKTLREAPCTQTWKFWRHCCCRYGWYSIIVMPIITSGCLLSLYSSFGCDFVDLEVGFTPSNEAWNQSSVHLGLFSLYTGREGGNYYEETLLDGCEWYSDAFEFNFIEGDRTWKVARIMALISGAAGITATITSWLFIFSPLPASFFWPGLLLPAVLVAFLAEGSKFLMFDTAVCRTALWTPIGVDSLAQKAESCTLGNTAVHTIISGCIFFIALMFVCLKAPEKRALDEHYGLRYDDYDDNMQPEQAVHVDVESALSVVDCTSQGSYPRGSDVYIVGEAASQTDRSLDFESVDGRSSRSSRVNRRTAELKAVRSESSSVNSDNGSYNGRETPRERRESGPDGTTRFGRESRSARRPREDSSRDDIADAIYPSKLFERSEEQTTNAVFDDRMSAAEIAIRRSEQQRISESRVSKIEKMELSSTSESEDLIEQFVSDLDQAFHQQDSSESSANDNLAKSSSHSRTGKTFYQT